MRLDTATALELPEPFVREAAELVRRRTGLVISEARRDAFVLVLERAMREAGVREPVVYLADLAAAPALLDTLMGAITVGETYFFREPAQFQTLREQVIPALLARTTAGRPLRIWSAGCATGEEPYSIAILLHSLGALNRAQILATDISRPSLAWALRARYGPWSFRGVPDDIMVRYFTRSGSRHELLPGLRSAVEFQYLNLAEATYPSAAFDMDLIMCRNVLIYMGRDTVSEVVGRLVEASSAEGWLLFGATDPVNGCVSGCETVMTSAGLMYRRGGEAGGVARAEPVRLGPAWVPPPQSQTPAPVASQAVRIAQQPLRVVPTSAPVAAPLDGVAEVRALAGRGELAEAERACAHALERNNTSAELYVLHAMLLTEARQYEAAAVAARRALYLDRSLAVAHLALGAALAGLGNAARARRAFASAERLLTAMPAECQAPASGGEPAGRLAELAHVELELLREAVA